MAPLGAPDTAAETHALVRAVQGFTVRQVLHAIEQVTGTAVPHHVGPRRAGDPAALPPLSATFKSWALYLQQLAVSDDVRRAAEKVVRVLETLLKRRCLETIGLARRAGIAVAGFEKVREALKHGKAGVLLAASDGAEDGRAKVRGLAGDAPVIDLFDAGERAAHAIGVHDRRTGLLGIRTFDVRNQSTP